MSKSKSVSKVHLLKRRISCGGLLKTSAPAAAAAAGSASSGVGMEPRKSGVDEMLRIQNTRLQEKIKRQSRTHALLVSIVVVFALSWFPLNVLGIVLDVRNIFPVRKRL